MSGEDFGRQDKIDLLKIKKIYFVGIGGIGTGSLALLLKEKGIEVEGSDIQDSYTLNLLRQKGIKTFLGHSKDNISEDVDLVCFSSAVRKDRNPEIQEALKRGIPVIRRGDLLPLVLEDKKVIAVAGSHGKTTIAGIISWLLYKVGIPSSIFVGGYFVSGMENAIYQDSDYVVVETDESDATFLNFKPHIGIVSNIDKEHLNFYTSFYRLKESFKEFVKNSKLKILCAEDVNLKEFRFPRTFYYGLYEGDITASVERVGKQSIFKCYFHKTLFGEFILNVLGIHNILNSLPAVFIGIRLGLESSVIKEALYSFPGIKRRLEFKGEFKNIQFYDDYAHHPQEIKASIQTLKSLRPQRMVVIFQPHRFSRVKNLFRDFVSVLKLCDCLILTDIYSAQEEPLEGVNSERIYKELLNEGFNNVYYFKKDEIKDFLLSDFLREGDMVVSMGAGDIYKTVEEVIKVIKEND